MPLIPTANFLLTCNLSVKVDIYQIDFCSNHGKVYPVLYLFISENGKELVIYIYVWVGDFIQEFQGRMTSSSLETWDQGKEYVIG